MDVRNAFLRYLAGGGSEQHELTRDHGCNLLDNLAMPPVYYVNPNISHEATSFARMRNLFWRRHRCEPKGKEQVFILSRVTSRLLVSLLREQSALSSGMIHTKEGEPVFVLEGSSNIQRPLVNLQQNKNPQKPRDSGHTTASPFQSVSGVEFI